MLQDPKQSRLAAAELTGLAKAGFILDCGLIDGIAEGLNSANADVRCYSAEVLGWIHHAKVIKPLAKTLLEDKNTETRQAAASALAKVGDFSAAETLIKALADADYHVIDNAISGLERLTNQSLYTNEIEEKKNIRIIADKWIALWSTKSFIPQNQWIVEGFQNEDINLRNLADKENITLLMPALKHKKWYIQYNANECLKKITGQNFESIFFEPIEYFHWKKNSEETNTIIIKWEEWWRQQMQKDKVK